MTHTKVGVNLNISRVNMENIIMSIGNTLKDRRISLNVKQEDIAEQMGVTVQTVSKWERDLTEPKASQVCQLSSILKITEKEICRGTTIGDKSDPFDFVRKVSILMKEVPHTELLVGMQDFIDDEEGFLKMLAKISEYPFDLFSHSDKNNDYLMNLFESGQIKFDTKEEEDNFLATIFPKK
jgi:transcriptional regulator with XRE-family HTH domain